MRHLQWPNHQGQLPLVKPQNPAGVAKLHHSPALVCRCPSRVLFTTLPWGRATSSAAPGSEGCEFGGKVRKERGVHAHTPHTAFRAEGFKRMRSTSTIRAGKQRGCKFISKYFPFWIFFLHSDRYIHSLVHSLMWAIMFKVTNNLCPALQASHLPYQKDALQWDILFLAMHLEEKAEDLWVAQLCGTPRHPRRWQLHSCFFQGVQNDRCTYFTMVVSTSRNHSKCCSRLWKRAKSINHIINVYSELTFYWTNQPHKQTSTSSAARAVLSCSDTGWRLDTLSSSGTDFSTTVLIRLQL